MRLCRLDAVIDVCILSGWTVFLHRVLEVKHVVSNFGGDLLTLCKWERIIIPEVETHRGRWTRSS